MVRLWKKSSPPSTKNVTPERNSEDQPKAQPKENETEENKTKEKERKEKKTKEKETKEKKTKEKKTKEKKTKEKKTKEKEPKEKENKEKKTKDKETKEKITKEKKPEEKKTKENKPKEKKTKEKKPKEKKTKEKKTKEKKPKEKKTKEKKTGEKETEEKETDEYETEDTDIEEKETKDKAEKLKPEPDENDRFSPSRAKLSLKPRGFQFFSWFFSYKQEGKMSKSDFMLAAVASQISVAGIVWLVGTSFQRGSIPTLIMCCVSLIINSAPVYMLYFFMGLYTRRGYLKFWDSVPMFKGMGYVILFHELVESLVHEIESAVSSLIYIYTTFVYSSSPYERCDFEYPEDIKCTPLYTKHVVYNCQETQLFASQIYDRYAILNEYTDEEFKVATTFGQFSTLRLLMLAVVVLHLLYSVHKGIEYFHRRYRKLLIFSAIYLAFVFVWCGIMSTKFERIPVMTRDQGQLWDIHLYVDTVVISTERCGPGTMLYLASLAPENTSPTEITLYLAVIKIIFVVLFIVGESYVITVILGAYGFGSESCVHIRGREIFYAAIPDVLTYLPVQRVFLFLYFWALYVVTFASCFYVWVAAVNCFIEDIPRLAKYRVVVCFFTGLLLFIASVPYQTQVGTPYSYVWFYFACVVKRACIMCIFSFVMTYIYTIRKVEHDYEFTFNTLPQKFWTFTWRLNPMLMAVTTVVFARSYRHFKDMGPLIPIFQAIIMTTVAIFCLPLVIWFGIHLSKRMGGKSIHSAETWGPPTEIQKQLRRSYNPEKQIGYKMVSLICDHRCLVCNEKFQQESEQSRESFDAMVKEMEGDKNYEIHLIFDGSF